MTAPSKSIRLQVVERIIEILGKIAQGTTYHYTPKLVTKRLMHYNECPGFPVYMVQVDSSPEPPESHLDNEEVESIAISIKCWVDTELGEAVTKAEKCLQDVRAAIEADHVSTETGSLGLLCGTLAISTVETDSGWLCPEGFGFFDQRIIVQTVGRWGTI